MPERFADADALLHKASEMIHLRHHDLDGSRLFSVLLESVAPNKTETMFFATVITHFLFANDREARRIGNLVRDFYNFELDGKLLETKKNSKSSFMLACDRQLHRFKFKLDSKDDMKEIRLKVKADRIQDGTE